MNGKLSGLLVRRSLRTEVRAHLRLAVGTDLLKQVQRHYLVEQATRAVERRHAVRQC
jgi:hypothetical protein